MTTEDLSKRRSNRNAVAAYTAYVVFVVVYLVAGWSQDPRLWGLHSLAFLTLSRALVATLVLAALLLPPVGRAVGTGVVIMGLRAVGSRRVAVLVGAGALLPFAFSRIEFHFLGDGIAWSNGLRAGTFFYYFEPLAIATTRFVARVVDSNDLARSAGALSILLGPIYVYTCARLCRTLWTEPHARGMAWALLLFNPLILFFFGYLESYPLLVTLQVVFVWSLVECARERWPAWVPVLVAGVSAATHVAAVSWLPALMLAMYVRGASSCKAEDDDGRALTRNRSRALRSVAAPVIALVVAALLVRAVGVSLHQLVAAIGGSTGLGGHSWSWLFSVRHGVDLFNEMLLLLGPTLVLVAGAGSTRLRTWRVEWLVVVALLVGPLTLALVIEPRIGGARDWDLFTPLALPTILICVEAWRRTPVFANLAHSGRVAGLALVTTMAWLAVGVSVERSAQRLEVLQSEEALLSNYARGYANETLGIYYRDHDPIASRDAWQRATRANPSNARYFNNLGNEESRLGNAAAACEAYRRTLALGMNEYFALFNAAACARVGGQLSTADSLLTVLVERTPERHEAWSDRGFVRLRLSQPERALRDLQEATRLAPRDAENVYRVGLAYMELGQLERARAAWEHALELQPDHPRAQRRLRGMRSDQDNGADVGPAQAPGSTR